MCKLWLFDETIVKFNDLNGENEISEIAKESFVSENNLVIMMATIEDGYHLYVTLRRLIKN